MLLSAIPLQAADAPGGAPDRELRFWIHTRDRGIEAALRAFERRNPGVRIVVSLYRDGRESQKLMTAIAGGDPPDVVVQDRFTVGEWASRSAFLPLDELIARTQQSDRPLNPADFYHTCMAEAMYEGRIYAIPHTTDVRALYYNEALLRKAGFVDAEGNVVPPRDWDELREYAIKLTERDATGRLVTLGFAPNWGNSWLYLYGWLNGGRFMSDDGRTVLLNEPAIVEALAYMDSLYRAVGGVQAVDAFIGSTSGQEFDPFATGRVAMVINGDWYTNLITQYHPNLPFRVAPPPAPRGKASVTWSGGFSYVVPATSKQSDLAFELIRFLVSDEGYGVINEVNAQYAASRGRAYVPQMSAQPKVNEWVFERYMMNDPRIPQRVKDAQPLFRSLMTVSRFRPVTPVGQLLWDEHVRAIEETVRGGRDPQTVLNIATAKVQRRLDELLDEQPRTPVNWWPIMLASGIGVIGLVGGAVLAVLRRSARSHHGAESRAALVFVSPWAIGFLAFTLGPVLASLVYSFCHYDVIHPAKWAGMDNYARLLNDEMFWRSLANTAYMLLGVPLGLAAGLAIALLLNHEIRGMKIYRTLFYLPAIVPVVASSILWIWVLNPTNGLINSLLRMIGIDDPPLWLNSPSWLLGSKAAILLMGLWGAGGGMIIWLAGLKGIPRHLYEAAEIDGAGPLRRFFHVTLPMLTPYIFFNLIIGVIGTMQIFTQAFIMTAGGPADSTLFYALYLFNSAFRYFDMGYASALAWVMLVLILLLTLLQMWGSRRWVYYEG